MRGPPATEETHQIEALMQAVEELRRRIAALEQWSASVAPGVNLPPQPALAALPTAELPDVSPGILSALGRLLLGIAGAYLLRAITESELVPQLAGTILGLLYAAGWLVSTVRISTGNRLSVAMHGVTAACIVAPLLWEATVRFHTVSTVASASALALFVILGQAFAWQHDHSALAGVTAFAGAATALALIIATLDPVPFTIALIVAAAVVEFGAWCDRALGWRWIVALACDICVFLLLYLVSRPQGLPEGYAPVPIAAVGALSIALVAIYVASVALRTLSRKTSITWFELLQVATCAALAIGGGLRISHGAGGAAILIGIACLGFGAACYLVAFGRLARAKPRNFHAYATFALLLMLAGGVLATAAAVPLWIALALVAAWLGASRRGNTLPLHSATYLLSAAAAAGLLTYSEHGLPLNSESLSCAAAAAIGYGLILGMRKDRALDWPDRVPGALMAALLCWSLVGLAAGFLQRAHLDPPVASTLSTALIVSVAVALAWIGTRKGVRELIWLLFPWMIFGGMKLAAEDFQQGSPATLFLSLLVYGGTLIALPRLFRRSPRDGADAAKGF
jgi:hypothetical protein